MEKGEIRVEEGDPSPLGGEREKSYDDAPMAGKLELRSNERFYFAKGKKKGLLVIDVIILSGGGESAIGW